MKLTLKAGAQVMLLINKDIDNQLINGSRGVVTRFDKYSGLPFVKFTNGQTVKIDNEIYVELKQSRVGCKSLKSQVDCIVKNVP